jgi:arsenate reductase
METSHVSAAFAALGQPTRLDAIGVLVAAGDAGLPVGEIAERLGTPASTLSFHLKALEQAGLVEVRRSGRNLIHAVRAGAVRDLARFLVRDLPAEGGEGAAGSSRGALRVLFLCTRNSARSILAEALLRDLGRGRFVVCSAGTEPAADGPMPEIVALLRALGHDVSALRSKHWEEFAGEASAPFDFVITLCDIVAGQACPEFQGVRANAAWPMPDPAKFSGSAAERATLLNELYAGLRRRLEIFAALPLASLERMALEARIGELANPHAIAVQESGRTGGR